MSRHSGPSTLPSIHLLALAIGAVSCLPANAHIEEVVVEGRRDALVGDARSASEGIIGQVDLALRPVQRPGDILEAIPGMIVTQHSGSGKSNQMFLRGFNLDHGTDFATWIDGMPVNMRTHGHGQGYTDANFLIPEIIESLHYVKGPYHAELGDFSSAGGVHINTFHRAPDNRLQLEMGEDNYQRLLAMGGATVAGQQLFAAIESQYFDGPWTDIDGNAQKLNGLLRLSSGDDRDRQWSITAMYYDNDWDSADQIPQRAVDQGLIDELGSLDERLGGNSRRASLSAQFNTETAHGNTAWGAYVIDYEMQLWSNFTYFLDDPVNGDQFEQLDKRRILGGHWNHGWLSGSRNQFRQKVGVEVRHDDISDVGLYHTANRQRLATTREDSVEESSAALFYEMEWHFHERWRAILGLRGDYYRFDVDADNPLNSGDTSDSIVSPKASLIYALSPRSEMYLSAGRGFHSNDARGTTIRVDPGTGSAVDKVDPLVRSTGAEWGIKSTLFERWNTSVALWYLELDSELLFVGDAGTTEASRPSRRRGVEFNNFITLSDIWTLEADLAWTDAEFSDRSPDGQDIPGALPFVATAGLTANAPNGWFGSLHLRHFASYPLIEDDSVESDGSTLASATVGWGNERVTLQLDVLNLLDSDDHDIDYFYASRLPGEPAAGIEDIHYKVFEPRQLRARLRFTF